MGRDLGQLGANSGGSWTELDPGKLTEMQNQLLEIFSAGAESLVGSATELLFGLCVIQVAWSGYQIMWGEAQLFPKMARTMFKCGLYIGLVTQAPALFEMLFKFFIDVGVEAGAGGADASLMRDPGAIPVHTLEMMAPVFVELQEGGGWMDGLTSNPVSMFFAALIGFCIVILAMVMALQVFVTTLEFYVIAAVGLVFMPFGVLKPTSFLADNFYSAILAVGTKMMVLSAIVAATDPMIGAMGLTEQYSLNHLFGILMVMMAMTVLYLRGPSLAAGLMSGRASLSASSAMGAGRAVAAPVIGVGAGVAAGVAGGASGGAGMVASGGVGGALKKGGAGSAGAVIGAGLGGVSGAAGGLKEQASEIGRQSD